MCCRVVTTMENSKVIKIMNKKQFEALVQSLENHPHVAKGQRFAENSGSSDGFSNVWEEITQQLNSLGPPVRNVLGWQKVWNDLKLKTKKKLAHNKKEINATGGGPNNLKYISPVEETVISLLSLDKTVNRPGRICGVPLRDASLNNQIQESLNEILEETNIIPANNIDRAEEAIQPRTSNRKKTKCTNISDYRKNLLEKQTKETTYLTTQIKEMKYNLRQIVKLKEEKLKILKEREQRDKIEAELKIEILQLEKRKLELEIAEKEDNNNVI